MGLDRLLSVRALEIGNDGLNLYWVMVVGLSGVFGECKEQSWRLAFRRMNFRHAGSYVPWLCRVDVGVDRARRASKKAPATA